ncbi:DNA polymerase IV [Terasakiella brassicae]|uniref:DNA polymerase IV n=1 Tax=Terasakiella brassicae TaxID=1634917 RepID=A0A917BVT1_9PROT|nr:DNA polymerase IV [Terasakiella brassicae]GGF60356.1 DNA polymerase IV [Terasakiella brassicae]
MTKRLPTLCRDCAHSFEDRPDSQRCPKCGSVRLLSHPELNNLYIAHIDCDSFFATVEKRDNPALKDKPVVVGGRHRGVVAAACYIARIYGVRSAMPMMRALKLCPDLVVVPPSKGKYGQVGREVRNLMFEATPMVEPLSIDEAFLDLSGTEALHGGSPARTLVRLIKRIETEIGITASVGLSYNKSLAKLASDLDKPRGFAILGRSEALDYLTDKPVKMIFGVGAAMEKKLASDGIATIGQLRAFEKIDLMRQYGAIGARLYHFCRAEDDRKVTPQSETKSVSNEVTLDENLHSFSDLKRELYPLCQKISERMKKAELAGRTVTLKLKTTGFRNITRSRQLPHPTQSAEELFNCSVDLLEPLCDGRSYRLIGTGFSMLQDSNRVTPVAPDLFDMAESQKDQRSEKAIEEIRRKYGGNAIVKGRLL